VIGDLAAAVAERDRAGGWRRTVVDPDAFERLAAAAPFTGAERVFIGDAITHVDTRRRFAPADAPYAPYTAGELAREWLRTVLWEHDLDRIPNRHYVGGQKLGPALFFDPPADRGGEWCMIDIRAAYWTLYSRHALDVGFRLNIDGTFSHRPGDVTIPTADLEWVGAEKPLRNAAWGVMQAGPLSWWEGGRMRSKPSRSRFAAPGLVALVLAQINAIAWQARALGAVMFLTDAAICRAEDMLNIAAMFSQDWGLSSTLKASGTGYLYGLGDYVVGDHETAGGHEERGGFDGLAQPFGTLHLMRTPA
jgi:hypothetical protein